MMINIKISEEDLMDLITRRVEFWTADPDIQELYRRMYDSYVYGGCFDGVSIDIMEIVDNDCVHYCTVLSEGDEEYDNIRAIYDKQGVGDCSCEHDYYGFIEAAYNGLFLVRC